MKPDVAEWVRCAEEDFTSATILMKARRRVSTDNAVCFHCQQCIEKYLKGRLVEAGIKVPFTHDLEALLQMSSGIEPLWAPFQPAFSSITGFAVMSRYPGQNLTRADARFGLKTCRAFRREARLALGLPVK